MIRIGQLIEGIDARSGGTTAAFLSVVEALARLPEQVRVVAYASRPPEGDPAYARMERLETVTWRLTGRSRPMLGGELGRMVARDVELGRIDALQIHGVWSMDLVRAARACRVKGVPYFWTPHGMLLSEAVSSKAWKKRLFLRLGLANALRGAAGYFFASSGEAAHTVLPEGASAASGVVLGLPIEVPASDEQLYEWRREGRARYGFAEGDEVVVFAGRLHPVKRLERLIDAVAVARASRPAVKLLLLGDGDAAYASELRARAAASLGDAAVFAGWVSGADKWRGLAAGDIAVLCSVHENFGYGAVEPLGAGAPVVVTDNLSLAPEIVEAGVGEIAAEGGADPAGELGAAILRLLGRGDRQEVGAGGRKWVRERYSPEAFAGRILRCVASAKQGAGRSR